MTDQPIPTDHFTEAFAELRTNGTALDGESWTEADTRSKFIDTVLITALGWTEDDIRRELSQGGERLDYRLSTTVPLLVVEAKRASNTFPLNKPPTRSLIKLASLLTANPSLKSHIDQAAGYAHDHSLEYACLTNGRSWIVFVASRTDGVPWRDGNALVIPDLYDPGFDFADLFAALSRDSVAAGYLATLLAPRHNSAACFSALATYNDPDIPKAPNRVGAALQPVLQHIFESTRGEDDPAFLRSCYVLPSETQLRDPSLEMPLLDSPPAPKGTDIVHIHNRRAFEQFESALLSATEADADAQLLVLLGNVGVGKTIFLKRFFNVQVKASASAERLVTCFVDFRHINPDLPSLYNHILDALVQRLDELDDSAAAASHKVTPDSIDLSSRSVLEQVFCREIARLRRTHGEGMDGQMLSHKLQAWREDAELFVHSAIHYIKHDLKMSFCLVIDNADHHEEGFQRRAYQAAKELESKLDCFLLIALQEQWFWRHRKADGILNAYNDWIFHLPAPRVREVLRKRIDFAITECRSSRVKPRPLTISNNIEVSIERIASFFKTCEESLLDEEEVAVALECCANGDVRRGISLFCRFMRSGHTPTAKLIEALFTKSGYKLTLDHLLVSLMRGDHEYYSGNRSPLPNLFALGYHTRVQQPTWLTCVYFLSFLARFRNTSTPRIGRGFAPRAEIDEFFRAAGFTADAANEFLVVLYEAGLALPDTMSARDIRETRHIRDTALGRYLHDRAIFNVSYIEGCMLDTPICDDSVRQRLTSSYSEGVRVNLQSIRDRCITVFLDYLSAAELRERKTLAQNDFLPDLIIPRIRTSVCSGDIKQGL